jgi:hypothetical protein
MLIEPNSPQQLIEQPIEALDCMLAFLQQTLFGFSPDADAEKIVGALDDLQWLSKIMAGHGEEHGMKIGGPLWVCPACNSQGYWLIGCPHDADSSGVGGNRTPLICVRHDVLASS